MYIKPLSIKLFIAFAVAGFAFFGVGAQLQQGDLPTSAEELSDEIMVRPPSKWGGGA